MKQHTLIIVPHARAKFRKWRFTSLQAGLVLGGLAVLSIAGALSTYYHLSSTFSREQLARVEAENSALREVNQGFASSIRDLEGQLGGYQQQIRKLAIVAGLAELGAGAEAGIGGTASLADEVDFEANLKSLGERVEGLGSGIDLLQERIDRNQLASSAKPAVSPVKGLLTSGFGYRSDPFTRQRAFHAGIDIVAPAGKPVRAPGDAIVGRTGRTAGLGNAVFLSHGFGITTRYGHLSRVAVNAGQRVQRGDIIGYVGNTGRATGYHLHYEVHVDGRPTNPLGFILDGTGP